MLKNFWYAIDFTSDVGRTPRRITCLGQHFVLYRTRAGTPVCLSDLCVHRGGALSGGRLDEDCIVCPYHGWRYEPGGACVAIPANGPAGRVPHKARVDSYPVRERYGFVWAFLGDLPESDRPPMPEWPEFGDLVEDGGRLRAVQGEYSWPANYERVLENFVDFSHLPFVHKGTFGHAIRPEVESYRLDQPDEWSSFATVRLFMPPRRSWWRRAVGRADAADSSRQAVNTVGWMLPNLAKLVIEMPVGDYLLYSSILPVDETTTTVKWIALRSFYPGRWADGMARRQTVTIFKQDARVVNQVRPELLPFDLSAELHVQSDLIQVAYRRRRQELAARGWLLSDDDRITGDMPRRTATVIASPARQADPELARAWVHKARGGDTAGRWAGSDGQRSAR